MKNWLMVVSLISVSAAVLYTITARCMESYRDFR